MDPNFVLVFLLFDNKFRVPELKFGSSTSKPVPCWLDSQKVRPGHGEGWNQRFRKLNDSDSKRDGKIVERKTRKKTWNRPMMSER